MVDTAVAKPAAGNETMRVRPETRSGFEAVGRLKGWKLVEAADRALRALVRSDPELRRALKDLAA